MAVAGWVGECPRSATCGAKSDMRFALDRGCEGEFPQRQRQCPLYLQKPTFGRAVGPL